MGFGIPGQHLFKTRRLLEYGHQNPWHLLEAGVHLRPGIYWEFYDM